MAFEYLIEDKVRNLKVMCNSAQMVKLFIVLNIFFMGFTTFYFIIDFLLSLIYF